MHHKTSPVPCSPSPSSRKPPIQQKKDSSRKTPSQPPKVVQVIEISEKNEETSLLVTSESLKHMKSISSKPSSEFHPMQLPDYIVKLKEEKSKNKDLSGVASNRKENSIKEQMKEYDKMNVNSGDRGEISPIPFKVVDK